MSTKTDTHYETDPAREGAEPFCDMTGCYVRARGATGWGSFDIAELTRASLVSWLRSRENTAERVLLHLLGHKEE